MTVDIESEAVRIAGLLIHALGGLGLDYKAGDGHVQTVIFRGLGIAPTSAGVALVAEVDMLRLPRKVSAGDLVKPETLHHLGAVCGHPVRCLNTSGVSYVVRLSPAPPPVRLPSAVPLDLGTRPQGSCLVPVGVSRSGAVWRDLAGLGHCLVSGASGSGKSNWLHAALAGLLTSAAPSDLRVCVVDPKGSEFAAWSKVPHLWAPIATDEAGAVKVLGSVVDELDRRGELLAGALVRDVDAYNKVAAVKLPRVLVIFDEVLDLLLSSGGERGDLARLLVRLAVKGRSAGITVWCASQHARADLLPRAVALNLSSRLVFRVLDGSAARLAGCPGAERIPRGRPGRFLAGLDGGAVETYQAFRLDDGPLLTVISGIVGADVAPVPAGLSDIERELVTAAVLDLGGSFAVGKLAAAFADRGVTNHQVRTIAKRWERSGLLSPAVAGFSEGRRVSPELARLAGVDRWHGGELS